MHNTLTNIIIILLQKLYGIVHRRVPGECIAFSVMSTNCINFAQALSCACYLSVNCFPLKFIDFSKDLNKVAVLVVVDDNSNGTVVVRQVECVFQGEGATFLHRVAL